MKKIICLITIALLLVLTTFSTLAQTSVSMGGPPILKTTNSQIFSIPWWDTYVVRWADIFGHEPTESEQWEDMARGLVGYNIIDFNEVEITTIRTNYDYESYTNVYTIKGSPNTEIFSLRVKEATPLQIVEEYYIRLNYSIYNCVTNQWVTLSGTNIGQIPEDTSDPSVFGAISNICIATEYLNIYTNGDLRIRTALYNALPINSPGYEQLYNVEYELGYQTGIQQGQEQYYNQGYGAGYAAGDADGYLDGYSQGVADNEQGNTGFKKLINAVITVPINSILGIFNFEILGVNLSIFIRGVISIIGAMLVVLMIKKWLL